MAQDQLYYPCGQEWNMSGVTEEKRFASLGHRDQTESGLDPTLFRMYSNTQGRWFSKDPGPDCPHDPQTLNRYTYASNSPLNHVDPKGDISSSAPFLISLPICDPFSPCSDPFSISPCWPLVCVDCYNLYFTGLPCAGPAPLIPLHYLYPRLPQVPIVPYECQVSFDLNKTPEKHACRGSNWISTLGLVGPGLSAAHIAGLPPGQVTNLSVSAAGVAGLTQVTGPPMQFFAGSPADSLPHWEAPFKFIRTGKTGEKAQIFWDVTYSCLGKTYFLGRFMTEAICQ
jgi:RHS repeat-associated protein